jgi:hypothetical protein
MISNTPPALTGYPFCRLAARRWAWALPVVCGGLFFAGCSTPLTSDPLRRGPFYTPTNTTGEVSLPSDLRRVMVLPLYGGELAPAETCAVLEPVFVTALQRENRFEVITLSREECRRRFGVESIASTSVLPRDLLPGLRRDFAVDGVMFIELTAFAAYRPLTLGVRAKLAVLTDSHLVWSFDNIFASENPAVANSARRHFMVSDGRGVPGDLTPAVLQSPSRYAEYVAAAMFVTLPAVYSPVAGVASRRRE